MKFRKIFCFILAGAANAGVVANQGSFSVINWWYSLFRGSNIPSYCWEYKCKLVSCGYFKGFRANLFDQSEKFSAYHTPNCGISFSEHNIDVNLLFKSEDNMNKFQSAVRTAVALFRKRKQTEDNFSIQLSDEKILKRNEAECHELVRVFYSDYVHNDLDDGSPAFDPYDDANSSSIYSAEQGNAIEAEVRVQMIENASSSQLLRKNPEICHIKDKSVCHHNEKNDVNNFIYMSRFLHEYFDGINTYPKNTPQFIIHYVSHDENAVDCPILGNDVVGVNVVNPLVKRHRTIVKIKFIDDTIANALSQHLRDGAHAVVDSPNTYQLDMYFVNPVKACEYLRWKEAKTLKSWDWEE